MNRRPRHLLRLFLLLVLATWTGLGWWHTHKPMPAGLDVATPWVAAGEVAFLADSTYTAPDGSRETDRAIFDEILRLIRGAERQVVLDMFLFNDFAGGAEGGHRELSAELTDALVRRKRERPDLRVTFITDPINTVYGSQVATHLERLERAGVNVVVTDLDRLRASNPVWSGLWRLCCQWLDPGVGADWLPNPLDEGGTSPAAMMRLLNFKANHRKTFVADAGDRWVGLVTSANPHDASSRHDNVALRFAGRAAIDLLATEQAVAAMSGAPGVIDIPEGRALDADGKTNGHIRILTESRIRDAAVELIDAAEAGDRLDMAMFYLAHRAVVDALLAAQRRGVRLRVLLDANRDAFGREKGGIPNRPVGRVLHRAGVPVRWCHTQGEQCHSKFLLHRPPEARATLLLGSANFTRRNIDNYNLETDVEWRAPADHPVMQEVTVHFRERWGNGEGNRHSLPFKAFADDSAWQYWRYRLMEASGLSTF